MRRSTTCIRTAETDGESLLPVSLLMFVFSGQLAMLKIIAGLPFQDFIVVSDSDQLENKRQTVITADTADEYLVFLAALGYNFVKLSVLCTGQRS